MSGKLEFYRVSEQNYGRRALQREGLYEEVYVGRFYGNGTTDGEFSFQFRDFGSGRKGARVNVWTDTLDLLLEPEFLRVLRAVARKRKDGGTSPQDVVEILEAAGFARQRTGTEAESAPAPATPVERVTTTLSREGWAVFVDGIPLRRKTPSGRVGRPRRFRTREKALRAGREAL